MSTNAHSSINVSKYFSSLIAENRLAHAYLFWGESASTLTRVARSIIALLECGKAICDAPALDSRELMPDSDGVIRIEHVRDAINFLWQKPIRAERKTLFVNGAEAMTGEAQGAFLKIVEEPPEHGLIVINALDPRILPPALASRFQKIYVTSDVSEEEFFGAERKAAQLAKRFVLTNARERAAIIKSVLEAEELPRAERLLTHFVRHCLLECHKDPVKHVRLMSRLTERWAKMQEANVNKKLQLETLLEI